MENFPSTYEYLDKKLGDSEAIVVKTSSDVFYPTSTTALLLRAVRKNVSENVKSALDLGCGCGIVAIALAKYVVKSGKVYASDISEKAVELARENAKLNGVDIECRCGSLFEPWKGMKFDVIVDDVSGMSEPIARISRWYPPQIHSDAGEDGARWITQILELAGNFLTENGKLFFPVLTLSDERKILDTAKKFFNNISLVEEQWYPLNEEMIANFGLIKSLHEKGVIEIEQRGSRWWWGTKIYIAFNT